VRPSADVDDLCCGRSVKHLLGDANSTEVGVSADDDIARLPCELPEGQHSFGAHQACRPEEGDIGVAVACGLRRLAVLDDGERSGSAGER
jgi:hypothetical protein